MIISPLYGASTTVTATTTHSSTSVGTVGNAVHIANTGTVAVYFHCGVGTQEANTSDPVVLAGESLLVDLPESTSARHVALESISSTAAVVITPCNYVAGR